MSICQVDCLSTYSCNAQVIGAYDGAIFEPWVELTFGKNMSITGGNKSSPPNNLATIRSFSYGQGGGGAAMGADFEIIDVGGTMYRQIIKAIKSL